MEEMHFAGDRGDRFLEGDLPGAGKSVGVRGAGGECGKGKRGGEGDRALAEVLGETRKGLANLMMFDTPVARLADPPIQFARPKLRPDAGLTSSKPQNRH